MDIKISEISVALQKGRVKNVETFVGQALESGFSAEKVLGGLLSGMGVVGEKFKDGEFFVPEVMAAAKAMSAGMEILRPLLAKEGAKPLGKAIIGTVKGDRHDIGKNLVRVMLEGAGFEVIDLGVDVSAEKFAAKQKETGARLVCLSSLLTTTMGQMGRVVEVFKQEGIRGDAVIMIGGAPVTDEFRKKIGADLYAPDAGSAAAKAKSYFK